MDNLHTEHSNKILTWHLKSPKPEHNVLFQPSPSTQIFHSSQAHLDPNKPFSSSYSITQNESFLPMQFYPLNKAQPKTSLFGVAFPNHSSPVTALQHPRAHTVYTNHYHLHMYYTAYLSFLSNENTLFHIKLYLILHYFLP